jgi:hypothetical protein
MGCRFKADEYRFKAAACRLKPRTCRLKTIPPQHIVFYNPFTENALNTKIDA